MGLLSNRRNHPGWLRFRLPLMVLTLGALAFGWLAWMEGNRAENTAEVLMNGYAAFIADKFEQTVSIRYKELSGIHTRDSVRFDLPPFEVLRQLAYRRDAGDLAEMPPPSHDFILYYFAYDSQAGELEQSGSLIAPEEQEKLQQAVHAIHPSCATEQLTPLGQLEDHVVRDGEEIFFGWSGLVRSAGEGRQVYGFRVDQQRLAEKLLIPLISPSGECDCPSELLPSNLASIRDIRQIAALTLRDSLGRVVHDSRADPEAPSDLAARVTRPLPFDIPFPGWTLEVVIQPAASEALLPFRRGLPWVALGLLGLVVGGSAALAVRSLRRNEELLRLRQDFVSNVSHELKTPLARIRLFNELLIGRKQKDLKRRGRYRDVIDRECRRLTFLIENVLNFSRLERGAKTHKTGPVDLKQLAEEALESFRAATDPQRSSFSRQLEEVPVLQGDAAALQQAIINLLDNADKYSPAGSPVQLRLSSHEGRIRLEVQDQGRGIPEKEQERIFEEFYRTESGDEQEVSGSGLGLALVRRTVRDHGGRVWVESRPGRGSTFIIEFGDFRAKTPSRKAERTGTREHGTQRGILTPETIP